MEDEFGPYKFINIGSNSPCVIKMRFIPSNGDLKEFWLTETVLTEEQVHNVYKTSFSSDYPCINLGIHYLPDLIKNIQKNSNDNSITIPTQEQWEYAARANNQPNSYIPIDDYSWNYMNAHGKFHSVGTKKPNSWGLYDMLGNTWQLTFYNRKQYHGQPTYILCGGDVNSVELNFAKRKDLSFHTHCYFSIRLCSF